jgi:hypothetical protein
MDGGGTLIYATLLLTTSVGVSAVLGTREAFGAFTVGIVAGRLGFALAAARRLLRLGFAHADLGPAFRAELDNAREERIGVSRIVAFARTMRCASVRGVVRKAFAIFSLSARTPHAR